MTTEKMIVRSQATTSNNKDTMIDQIILCGHRISVRNVEHLEDHTIATSDYAAGAIRIISQLPTDAYYCTLIHEVVHLIMNMDGMRDPHNERDVCAMSNGIFQFIKDNATVIQRILADTPPMAQQSVTALEPRVLQNNATAGRAARGSRRA
jgi:hypothetical protein